MRVDRARSRGALAYASASEMTFGVAPRPVQAGHGVVLGGGEVLPEAKFTLPPMQITPDTMDAVRTEFREMITHILDRCLELQQPAIVLEIEHLFELTQNPDWGALITLDARRIMDSYHQAHGLRSALRVTVADIRDVERPPKMLTGEPLQAMLRAFELNADAGADILSIESTGGKEVHDRALLAADIDGIAYALGVLAPQDMRNLWAEIVAIARQHGVVAGGDTACGFGNTAMQLAHQRMLPRVLAAAVRPMTAPRSLVAVEMGATGPLKDCGYENPVIKAITGVPISMEGKTSACAHSSPLGNIAAAMADLWSNEAVQNVRLLSGNAPEVFTEMLIYDARLLNTARAMGHHQVLRDLLVRSDRDLDPQALMLDPEVVYGVAQRIVQAGDDDYSRVLAAARYGLEVIEAAVGEGRVRLSAGETRYLGRIADGIGSLPATPDRLRERVAAAYGEHYLEEEYRPAPRRRAVERSRVA